MLQQFTISHQGDVYACIAKRPRQLDTDSSSLIIASIVSFSYEGGQSSNAMQPVTFAFDHAMLAGLKVFIDGYFKARGEG